VRLQLTLCGISCRLPAGRLFELICSRDHFDELEAASCIDQLLDVVQYLHNCRIAHLDIKVGGSTTGSGGEKKVAILDIMINLTVASMNVHL